MILIHNHTVIHSNKSEQINHNTVIQSNKSDEIDPIAFNPTIFLLATPCNLLIAYAMQDRKEGLPY